jgi:hypothetical protein
MVTEYTMRWLTYPSDVLPALSGLANAMARTHGCSYLAGLWNEDLKIGLAWYFRCSRQPAAKTVGIPTWSWASCWGNYIGFRLWKEDVTHLVDKDLASVSGSDYLSPSLPRSFVGTNTRRLTISGFVKRAIVVQETRSPD